MLVLLVSTPALGHNYYVSTSGNDSIGDGSMANPWRTVQYAVNQAYAGDTILVREGRYYESVIFPRSGTEESRIIVKAYPDENVYMDGSIAITGWEQCTSNEAGLTAGGLINVNYANIYKTKVKTVPTTLFENGQHCRTARWPDQTYGFGIDAREFQAVPTEAFGVSNAVKDNTHLNPQEDDSFWYSYLSKLNAEQLATYYNGAQLEIWLMFEGNYKQIKTITGHTNNSIVLESSLRRNLMTGDRYSIRNHPHALDSAGEFYCTPTTDAEGNYTLYLWPLNTNSLSSGIRKAASGHCFYAMDKDGITIDGLKIIGYSGRGILFSHETGSVHDNSYITVQNCTITDCGEDGIFIWVGPYAQIKNCSIARVGGRGAMVSTGSNAIIQGCDVVDSTDTCISFYGVKHGQIIDNRIYGSRGVHSNGSSCYVGCENILLARNIYYNKTNATFQDIKNVVVFANVIDGFGTEENRIGTWPDAYQGTSGYQLYLNNTFIRTARSNAAVFRLATIYAYNNLISGSAYWPNITHRSHNGWVGRWTSQTADSGWTLGEGSWQMPAGWMQPGGWAVATQAQYNSIFKDLDWDSYEIFDYSLADGDNPAVHTGRDIQQFLTDMGIKNLFPDFDFTKDISGNPWNSTPSMGAYEYVGGSGSVTPVTPPEITSHPADRSVSEGQTASFSVSATGSGTLTYQWQKNRVNIAGATASSYTTPVLAINDNNNKYRCIVTNAGGSATSNEATLTVSLNIPVPVAHWLFNEPYQSTAVDIISGQTASLINDPNWGEAWARENAIRLDTGIQAMQIPMGKCRPESGTIALRIRPENTDSMQILFGHALNSMDNRIALYSAAGSLALGIGNVLQAGICTLTAGQSCLVTVTWDNTDYAVFVDSDLKSSGVFNGFLQLDTTADVGNYGVPESRSSGLGFRGLVEDVQLFSTALTAEKINALSLTHYVRENRLVEFVVNGVDLEGNPISYTAPNLPSGATFNIATQTFSWHPSLYNQAGNYAVVFTAPDQPDHIVTVSVLDTNVAEWYVNFLESAGID